MRPSIENQPDVSSALVRAGNLWTGTKFIGRFMAGVDTLADKAEWREVIDLPPEMEEWQRKRKIILELSDPLKKCCQQRRSLFL